MRIAKIALIIFTILLISVGVVGANFIYHLPSLQQDAAVLILGKGGEGHTAPDLTDSIMVAFSNSNNNSIRIMSLPRDLWIPEIRAKINTAYYYGGFKMAGDSVYSITSIPITNTVVIDFSLFKDFVNSIGGIDVLVENSFVDEKYPVSGLENDLCNGDRTYSCRYETIHFFKGNQKMNGDVALQFVRSRNAEGDEGTDLAREKRQQKVVEAIKNKLLSKDVLLKPETIKRIYQTVVSHIETDIDRDSFILFARLVFKSRDNISFLSFPQEFVNVSQNNKKYDKQYVFIPKDGNWLEFQQWIKNSR